MKMIDRRLGTNVALHFKAHLFCLDCGSRILWRALIIRWWKHTACPSCEGYMELMTQGEQETLDKTLPHGPAPKEAPPPGYPECAYKEVLERIIYTLRVGDHEWATKESLTHAIREALSYSPPCER